MSGWSCQLKSAAVEQGRPGSGDAADTEGVVFYSLFLLYLSYREICSGLLGTVPTIWVKGWV